MEFEKKRIFCVVGLANKKTVAIQAAGKDQSVLLATTKPRKQNKPSVLSQRSVMKKEFSRMAKAVQNQVDFLSDSLEHVNDVV